MLVDALGQPMLAAFARRAEAADLAERRRAVAQGSSSALPGTIDPQRPR